ncbi:YsnF/AvaK domain-containing protein [Sphingomonas sp. PAMC 26617]|uniref:YsnF/AvaK domain-containing protein n=1 Tax=Sphingomonas sp. PAMC 26617 TaxID=1112216 RepID=UPI0002880486|nr:DUF2382 domain-containing protein [Sphingomonas sp. PAMC 26617]
MAKFDDQHTRVPIIEEVATVSKRTVESSHVRVRTVVEERTHNLVAELEREDIEIERRVVEREVSVPPAPYHEGELLIIPIVEERAIVEKRLFVVEEVVVRRVARTEEVQVPTTLRKMRAVIERDGDEV